MAEASGGRVLIVEDDAGVARLQQRRLERAGYSVISAASEDECLQKLQGEDVELVLLDYRLPGDRTGLDVYAQLKEAGHDIPVIMVTGFSDEATVIKALRAGVRDFVTKSVEYLDYLPEAVRRVLKQVRTEQQLAQSEARLAGIITSARDAILAVDTDHRITLFNVAAEQVFHCSASAAIGRSIHELIPATNNGTINLFGQTSADGHLCSTWFELQGIRVDGEAFPLEASISSTEAGGRKLCVIIVRDISERKRAEEQLREQAALLDQATNAILVRNMDDSIRFWNQGAERLFGWSAQEAIGRNANELLFKRANAGLVEARKALIDKGEWRGELQKVTKSGSEVIVESHWTLMRDSEGRPKCKLVINTDITEKKILQAQYLRAQRMESIGTLAGGIAHDLNNVLTPILMAVELLRMKLTDPASRSFLTTLQTSAERGADMVRQVLSFARGAEGERLPLQLKHVVGDIEKMLKHTLPKSIEIDTRAPKDLWTVTGDATQIYQVLMNLCINARDAMPAGGKLTVTAENRTLDEHFARMHIEAAAGPYVLLTVADTGSGMPAEVVEKIFDPFFTTKELGKGTGLGLSTALGIVQNHGGFISVYSEVGKGSQFSVYLPAIASAQTNQAQEASRHLPTGDGEMILVVDDEAAIRELTSLTLEAHGYRVMTANDGTEALALYAQHQHEVEAVIIDMMMPILDGPATIRALRKLDANVRVIAVSGLAANGKAPALLELAAPNFLLKPYTAEMLLTTLRGVLEEKSVGSPLLNIAENPTQQRESLLSAARTQ